jgi:Uma2 family endonuclease
MSAATEHRPQMEVDEFERLAEAAARDDITLEFIHGKLGVKAVPDGDHDEITMWLIKKCIQQRPDLSLYPERGLVVETYRNGRAKPDGTLAPEEAFIGKGVYAPADDVLMVAEVTSFDEDTDRRDRVEKPAAYAQTGIPVYLLVDRDIDSVTVYSEPVDGRYGSVVTLAYGHSVELPGLGITLETEELKEFAR